MDTNQIIDRILTSRNFSNKEVLKGLLRFLHEAYLQGLSLKEADIAIGYFKRGENFVPGDDTIVRVNIYKLRALIDKYYQEEGITDVVTIEIPKGSYQILFKNKSEPSGNRMGQQRGKRAIVVLVSLLAISTLVNVCQYIKKDRVEDAGENPVWGSYVNSSRPVYITLGDPFFYRTKNPETNGSLIIRDISINSNSELKARNPLATYKIQDELSELNYPYFSRNNLWPLPDIISFFAKAGTETRLQALSESNIDDIKNNNVIFIANINSFGWMNKFLERSSIRIFTNPREIHIHRSTDSLVLKVPEFVNGAYSDYAFLVKLPGPNNNNITTLGDFHASGLKGLSNYINKKQSLEKLVRQIEEKYGKFPSYFEMVVKVTSYNYSDFDTKLIYFKPLN